MEEKNNIEQIDTEKTEVLETLVPKNDNIEQIDLEKKDITEPPKKGNKDILVGIIIGVLITLIISLSSYIIYEKVIKKEDNPLQNEITDNNQTQDNTQDDNLNEEPVETPTPELKDFDINQFKNGSIAINSTNRIGFSVRKDSGFAEGITVKFDNTTKEASVVLDWSILCNNYGYAVPDIEKGPIVPNGYLTSSGFNDCEKRTNNKTIEYKISTGDKQIKKIIVASAGQTLGHETIFMAMDDGTVQYIPLWYSFAAVGIEEGTIFSTIDTLENVTGVVELSHAISFPLYKKPNEILHNSIASIAIRSDGTFYSMSGLTKASYYVVG